MKTNEQNKNIYLSSYDMPSEEEYKNYLIECLEYNEEEAEEMSNNENLYYEFLYDFMNMNLEDFFLSIPKSLDNQKYVLFGHVGLWNGRREIAPTIFDSLTETIKKCLYDSEYYEVSMNNKELNIKISRHDGNNNFTIVPLSANGKKKYEYIQNNTAVFNLNRRDVKRFASNYLY